MQSHPSPSARVCTPPEPGTIHYTPRPAVFSSDQYINQRRYGREHDDTYMDLDPRHNSGCGICATVYRPASRNQARLELKVGETANVAGWMASEELRDLARRLLDAAADIDELPSATLNSGKAGALALVVNGPSTNEVDSPLDERLLASVQPGERLSVPELFERLELRQSATLESELLKALPRAGFTLEREPYGQRRRVWCAPTKDTATTEGGAA